MKIGPGSSLQTPPAAADISRRWSDAERGAMYQRVLGAPGGSADDARANRDFNDLWLRFVTSAAQSSRQDPLVRRAAASDEFVRAARADFAAAALPRLDAAWAHRDLWSVIDQVAATELGGASNTARYRTLAQAGGAVLEWISTHRGSAADSAAYDQSLIDAAEQWLAVSGAPDDAVEAFAQPREAAARLAGWSRALFEALGIDGGATQAPTVAPRVGAVFAGADGTGKTIAAHWLASSLGRDLSRIDLSQVVTKYIGETEKNLDRVFGDASRSGAVLLFNEADALFGRRTDVRDAHDRYANLEVNALLQRIERYEGIAIVTSNAGAQIDPDVLKRANARIVAFPLPPR